MSDNQGMTASLPKERWRIMLPTDLKTLRDTPAPDYPDFADAITAHTVMMEAVRDGRLPKGCWLRGTVAASDHDLL